MDVLKRDGLKQPYDFNKIKKVISKAFGSVNQEVPDKFLEQLNTALNKYCEKKDIVDVEDIQDIIQNELIKRNKYEVVESFIIYRNKRAEIRERNSGLIKDIQSKLQGSNIENQNANVDEESFSGRIGEAARIVSKNDALKFKMSKKSRKNHEDNEIYVHDLDSYSTGMHNCLSMPIDKLLKYGFKTPQADVRGAGSVGTAMQLVAVLFQLQSLQQFGGVSATHLDWSMVPYVRKSFYKHYKDGLKWIDKNNHSELLSITDPTEISINSKIYKDNINVYNYAIELTNREILQAVESMYHNLNTLQSRSGGQLPFSSINYGTCTLLEGRMIIEALLKKSIEGTGKTGRTPIFPCGIFQYKKGINDKPGTPNYDLYRFALKSTAMRLYPNYANCDWSNQQAWIASDRNIKKIVINSLSTKDYNILQKWIEKYPAEAIKFGLYISQDKICISTQQQPFELFSTMGCRTANGFDVNTEETFRENIKSIIETGNIKYDIYSGAQKDGRGNICPVTIILPTLAMKAKEKSSEDPVKEFFIILDKKIDEAKDMLIERYNIIKNQSAASAKFMYENCTMSGYNSEEGIQSAIKHGTFAIGQIGLAETLMILINTDQTTYEGMELAKCIEQLFLDKTIEFKNTYKMNFGVYYTPAENLCKTAMDKFRNKYGVIEGVSDKKYFTNSMHVPVYKDMNPFKKIDIESQLTRYSNAGCITYVELPSTAINNIDALETIVNYAMNKDIPYFAINVPNDHCNNCGYTGEFNNNCPKCGSNNIKQLRRVTGYLQTDYRSFNEGKQQEVQDRVKHIKG